MLKLIRNHQKKVLAFFGVLLMLTFLGNRGTGGGNENADHVVGHLDGKAVLNSDVAEAHSELIALERYTSIRVSQDSSASLLTGRLGRQRANELLDKPELFLMLRNEARKSEASVDPAQLDQLMSACYQGPSSENDEYALTRTAVADLLMVWDHFSSVRNDLKLSRPVMNHLLADKSESLGVDFVQLQAVDYASRVPAPTPQQVQEQFNKFADVDPGTPQPGSNPFGFGYKLPVRARAQYLRVTADNLASAVEAAGPDGITRPPGWTLAQWWDLAGQKYYQSHLEEFRESPPADATTRPTAPLPIQPYSKVSETVLDLIRQPLTDKLSDDLKSYLNTAMTTGWQAYQQYATANPAPSTEPATSFGEPYSSPQFLQKIADQAHKRFNVTITAEDTGWPLPIVQLAAIPGFSNQQVVNFLVTQTSTYLQNADLTSSAAKSQLMRPSPPIQAAKIAPLVAVRLIIALPSERPKDLATVQTAIESDIRTAASYDLAKTDAKILLTAANKGALATAAVETGHSVVSTNPLLPLSMSNYDDPKADPAAVIVPPLGKLSPEFITDAFRLLGTYDPKTNPAPAELIELQPQSRLFVTQLKTVTADWSSETYYTTVLRTRAQVAQRLLSALADKWFDYKEVVQRTGFTSTKAARG